MKNAKSDNPAGDEAYFSGRKRLFQTVIQGRFKEQVAVSEVLTGHEFARPFKKMPPRFILHAAMKLAKRIAPDINIGLDDQPFIESTLGGTCKVVRADKPGNEPNITDIGLTEDCSLFGGELAEGNVPIWFRKQLLSDPGNSHFVFDTDKIYTFEFYEDKFSGPAYGFDLGFKTFSLESHLDGQPVQSLAKMRDGRYVWVSFANQYSFDFCSFFECTFITMAQQPR